MEPIPRRNGDPGDLQFGFLIDNNFVANGTVNLSQANAIAYSPDGTFRDYTFNYTSTAADAGKSLKIYFGQTPVGSSSVVHFDNVRLSVVATPEPSTYAMMALGLVALCVLGAKRKKGEQAI
jgi:hypothetical protein